MRTHSRQTDDLLAELRAHLAAECSPWSRDRAPGNAAAFGSAMLEWMREALASVSPRTAALAAFSAARNEAPLAERDWHVAWGRATLLWSARQLARAATESSLRGLAHGGELMAAALDCARAAHEIGGVGDTGAAPSTRAGEHLARVAHAALSDAHLLDVPAGEHAGFYLAAFQQLRHAAVLLASTGAAPETLVRAAIARADRSSRRGPSRAWNDLSAELRAQLAAHAVLEAAAAIALAAPLDGAEDDPTARESSAYFTRTATRISACATDARAWLLPCGVSPANGPGTILEGNGAPARGVEAVVVKESERTMLKTLETDARDAAWRTAGSQFVKLTREPLVGLLSRHLAPGDESARARVAAFLETEIGSALLASLLSLGLAAMPAGAGEVPQRLARELRVRAMADAGDVLADLLMAPLRQVAATYLQDATAVTARPANAAVLDDAAGSPWASESAFAVPAAG